MSLTLVEPPAFAFVRGDPYVEALIRRLSVALPTARRQGPQESTKTFFDAIGVVGTAGSTAAYGRAARATFHEPYPWTIDPPVRAQLAGLVPALIVSGGWAGEPDGSARHDAGLAFQRACERLAEHLDGRHKVVEGAGHAAQFTGLPFNAMLASFVATCTRSR